MKINSKKFILLFIALSLLLAVFTHVQASSKPIPQQGVVWQDSNVYVTFKYTPKVDMHLVYGLCGINNTFNLKAIYLTNNTKKVFPWITRKSKLFMKSQTDWLGPYGVKSLTNDDGGSFTFTSGWHGSNGDGSGKPTAKTISISVKVNGKPIKKNKSYYGNVEINVVNLIQAYNTKKAGTYALKEAVNFKFTPKKINIALNTTALDDVLLQRYYGLQAQAYSWNGSIQYSNGITAKYGKYSDSGPLMNSPAYSFTLTSANKAYKLRAKIDKTYGLGNFESLSPDLPSIFLQSYGKAYFNLVNGKDKKILKGNSFGWRGTYEFF
ncbi:MAG: hypothetical protein Q8942_10530 [Bacillota bacterium]|nr:hypothetical protein [Bacillota bacterium]